MRRDASLQSPLVVQDKIPEEGEEAEMEKTCDDYGVVPRLKSGTAGRRGLTMLDDD